MKDDNVYYNPTADEGRGIQARIKNKETPAIQSLFDITDGYVKILSNYAHILESNDHLYKSQDKKTVEFTRDATRVGRQLVEYNKALIMALEQLRKELEPKKARKK